MENNRGFTLVEILIALVIASLGTVTVGYFAAGVSRLHTESQAISSATILADTAMELVALHKDLQHPEIRELTRDAARKDFAISFTEQSVTESENLIKVTVTVSAPDLPKPLKLMRLIPMVKAGTTHD